MYSLETLTIKATLVGIIRSNIDVTLSSLLYSSMLCNSRMSSTRYLQITQHSISELTIENQLGLLILKKVMLLLEGIGFVEEGLGWG